MLEQTFLAPTHDNEGTPTAAALFTLESRLLNLFGGYTAEPARGAWRDDSGKVFRDNLTRYTISADWTVRTRSQLRAIVADFARDARQLSVYLRDDSGAVHFIEPAPADTRQPAPRIAA